MNNNHCFGFVKLSIGENHMKEIRFNYLLLLLLAILLLACQSQQIEQATTVNNISVQQLQQMMEHKDFTLVNVHIPYAGEIPNTDMLIPFNEISKNKVNLPDDKNTKLVLYCRSGHMSASAAKELIDIAYKNVYDVIGGMNAWNNAGCELIVKSEEYN